MLHLIDEGSTEKIKQDGQAEVSLGGRPFVIRKEFLEDVNETSLHSKLAVNRKPLLICHSPIDTVVGVDNAKTIYEAASHPKSFVSLDGADHLLRQPADAEFVADVISTWVSRYLPSDSEPDAGEKSDSKIEAGVLVADRNGTLTQDIYTPEHHLVADEPASVGGANLGVAPYDLLLAALGTCTSMTLRMYAQRKGLNVDAIKVRLQHDRIDSKDCENCEEQKNPVDRIQRFLTIDGELSEEQRARMLQIADMCPVHRTMMNQKQIVTSEES